MAIARISRKRLPTGLVLAAFLLTAGTFKGQAQEELPEITILTPVANLAFSAIWVAEQLDYFRQEGVRAEVGVAGGGAACLAAVVGRSADFCASHSDGVILSRLEGAPIIAVQAHNRTVTLSITVRREIVDRYALTRASPLKDRLGLLKQLGTIGASGPGASSHQIFKFLMARAGGDPETLKFAFVGGAQLPQMLMNGLIDAYALSPPSGENTETFGKGYVLIPLSRGEIPELTDYPYEVLVGRPDRLRQNRATTQAVCRAISRAGALIREKPQVARAALRAHPFFNPERLGEEVFDLSFSIIAEAIPLWGNMSSVGWQKSIDFTRETGMIRAKATEISAAEGIFWTNEFVGQGP